tara:strand:+ start:21247 stop:22611 length:1365 start_codon:yes stop_codon:yes gene_type:complete
MEKKVTITFYGGVGSPTGSNFMISDGVTKILVDCGLFQGRRVGEDTNRKDFTYDPKTVDALFVTHAHIDHIGRIPKLVRDGFNNPIYSTPPTKDISERMLDDTMGILGKEAKEDSLPPLYEKQDVTKAIGLWKNLDYHQEITVGDFRVRLREAGHILGSALIEFVYNDKRILFSGDLGNSPTPLLKDTESFKGTDYLVLESVYGDRNHEDRDTRKYILEDVIEETMKKGGALMIPAFSLERTQELLYELNDLVEHGRIPQVPVFIDSPLAIDVTKIYKKYKDYFNKDARKIIKDGDDIFNFPGLEFTYKTEESKAIRNTPNPKIIIAGSGMSNGGRIIHHEKQYLSDPKSTLLIVGYQVPGSLGRELQDGAKSVTILNEQIPVKARVTTIHGYSAHKDSNALLDAVAEAGDTLKKVFVVLGEPKSSLFLVQRIRDYLGIEAVSPEHEETIEINV